VGPDLAVTALTAAPTLADAGATVTVTDTTANSGGGTAPATATAIYLSADTVLDAGDTLLASRNVPALAPSATSSGSTAVVIPAGTAVGTWQLIAVADAGRIAVETNEANNTRSIYVRVGPDLKIASARAPSKIAAGASFSVTDSTTNAGGGPAAATNTRYYLSSNTTLDASDLELGAREVGPLAAGATSSATVTLTIPVGTAKTRFYLLVVADADGGVTEVYENNNVYTLAVTVN
jgi:subtilase family serine protease